MEKINSFTLEIMNIEHERAFFADVVMLMCRCYQLPFGGYLFYIQIVLNILLFWICAVLKVLPHFNCWFLTIFCLFLKDETALHLKVHAMNYHTRNLTIFDFEVDSKCRRGVSLLFVGQSWPYRSAQTCGYALSHVNRQLIFFYQGWILIWE